MNEKAPGIIVMMLIVIIICCGIVFFFIPIQQAETVLVMKVTATTSWADKITIYSVKTSWTFYNNGYDFLPDHIYKITVRGFEILRVVEIS